MIDYNQAPVAGALVHNRNHAVCRRVNRVAVMGRNIHARVERAFATERIQPFAEVPGDLADNRPETRHNS
jgi:hypothetical protein